MTIETNGYLDFAAKVGLSPKSIRNYYSRDREAARRGRPNRLLPEPEVTVGNLPGWTDEQIKDWLLDRPGPGNHTSGEERRGNRDGSRRRKLSTGQIMRATAMHEGGMSYAKIAAHFDVPEHVIERALEQDRETVDA